MLLVHHRRGCPRPLKISVSLGTFEPLLCPAPCEPECPLLRGATEEVQMSSKLRGREAQCTGCPEGSVMSSAPLVMPKVKPSPLAWFLKHAHLTR